METEFVNPNWHVALVHFPLGLLVAGVLIEVFSFMWRRHAFRAAGRWMILVGVLSAVPTAFAGIYALADVTNDGLDLTTASSVWDERAAASPIWQNHDQAHMLRDHVVLQSWGSGIALIVVMVWMGASDNWRVKLHLPLLALLLISTGLTLAGAWHGGEAVYRHGTGVQGRHPATQPSIAEELAAEKGAAPVEQQTSLRSRVEYFLPPLQVHMIMAGLTVAVAVVAIGLSFRAANSGPPRTEVDYIAAALGPPSESIGIDEDEPRRRREPQDVGPRVPTARFWLLAGLAGLLTILGGWWVLGSQSDTWNPQEVWRLVIAESENATRPWLTRRLAHVGGGASIVVLTLLMALVARFAPRARIVLLLLTLLLLAVVAAQIWFGILLTYDTVDGPITAFN